MPQRPFCGMAIGFLLGIWTAAYRENWVLKGMAAAVFVIAFCCFLRRVRDAENAKECGAAGRKWRWQLLFRGMLCILLFFAGRSRYMQEQEFRMQYQPYLKADMQLSVQGKLSGKQVRNNQYIYELTSCVIGLNLNETSEKVPVSCNRILIYSDSDVASIGEILVLDGTVELWNSAVNEGNYDEKSFYETRKTAFKLKDIKVLGVYGKESRWREGLWQLRLRLKEVYRNLMEPESGGILTTMILGDKELLSEETKRLYQVGGLSHILAISGLHISVIGMGLYRLLRKLGMGFGGAGILAGGILYGYGTLVGMGISVQRSMAMFLLLLFAQVVGRSYDTLNSLGAAAFLLLWKNPYLLWDAGFQFSFTAIIGVVWVGRCVSFAPTRAGKWGERLFVSAAIQLTTLPLAAWYYYEIPLYAILMNLLILPMMGILLSVGLAGGFVGLLSEKAARVVLFPCEKMLSWSGLLCGVCSKFPKATWITGRPGTGQMVCYYGLLAVFTLWAYRRKREETAQKANIGTGGKPRKKGREDRKNDGTRADTKGKIPGSRACREGGYRIRPGGGSFAVAGILLFAVLCFPVRDGFELDILDVGQGDASFLRTEQGYTIFVDGGSSNVGKVGKYRMLPFLKYKGVRYIDYWIVSHTDEDHICGLRELLEEGYEIRNLVFARGVKEDEVLEELLLLAEREGTEILYMNAGDILHLGTAEMRVLFPAAGNMDCEDKNAYSLVIRYEEGNFSGIFTGDIGAAEEQFLAESGGLEEVVFYKAAHHGSNYSNSPEFLEALSPRAATVSCGARNRYGHPGEEAVRHMEEAGSTVFYTMESGQIKLTQEGETLLVQKYLSPLDVSAFPMVE